LSCLSCLSLRLLICFFASHLRPRFAQVCPGLRSKNRRNEGVATSALRACPGLRSKDRGKPGRRCACAVFASSALRAWANLPRFVRPRRGTEVCDRREQRPLRGLRAPLWPRFA
jgi:hypothetical protein